MTDIVERLRRKVHGSTYGSGMDVPPLHAEAADTIEAQAAEIESNHMLIARQGDLLTCVVNAIRGEPEPLHLHSHHDAPDLAREMMAVNAELVAALEGLYPTNVGTIAASIPDHEMLPIDITVGELRAAASALARAKSAAASFNGKSDA